MRRLRTIIKTCILLLAVLNQSQTTFGQDKRVCDISAKLLSPNNGFTLRSPGNDSCKVQLTNLGPDTILPLDMHAITIKYGGFRLLPLFREYGLTLVPGDSISVTIHFKLFGTNDADNVEFCIHSVTSYTPSSTMYTPLLLEQDSAILFDNNTDCVFGIHRMKNSSVSELSKKKLLIFPNPCTTEITINNLDENHKTDCKIVDMTGKTVLSISDLNNHKTIDISMLSTGVYVVKVESLGQVQTGIVVKK